jgi:hypothetical protein
MKKYLVGALLIVSLVLNIFLSWELDNRSAVLASIVGKGIFEGTQSGCVQGSDNNVGIDLDGDGIVDSINTEAYNGINQYGGVGDKPYGPYKEYNGIDLDGDGIIDR